MVTSKHSLGKTPGDKPSHAEVGERWLRKYFADKGRTEADFAKVLWDNNWTAVAEVQQNVAHSIACTNVHCSFVMILLRSTFWPLPLNLLDSIFTV